MDVDIVVPADRTESSKEETVKLRLCSRPSDFSGACLEIEETRAALDADADPA